MPGLVLFNRKWNLASDDLFFPACYGVGVHALWYSLTELARKAMRSRITPVCTRLLTTASIYHATRGETSSCAKKADLHSYLVLTLFTLCLEIAVELTIARISLRGTVADDGPRRVIRYALNTHAFLEAPLALSTSSEARFYMAMES